MPQPNRSPLGEWIHAWRMKRQLTQEQLAHAALVTKRDIERYEKDMAPRGDTFLRLIDALGLSVDGLPSGPRAVNSELMELRKEVAALRRTLDRRLESLSSELAEKADAEVVQRALELLEGAAQDPRRTDEAEPMPKAT